MKTVIKRMMIVGLLALTGCVTGEKQRDADPAAAVKSGENPMALPPARITEEEITEGNARAKASAMRAMLSAELKQSSDVQPESDR